MMCLETLNSFRSEPSHKRIFIRTVQVLLDQNRQPLESCEPDPSSGFLVKMVSNMVQVERGY